MKRHIPALFYLMTVWPLQAQDNSFVMEPESPSVIGRISLLSPKLIAEIAPSDYFTLTTGFRLVLEYKHWSRVYL